MFYIDEEKRPEPVSAANFAVAVVLHVFFFALLWLAGQMTFREKEVVIPIELTVVPFENLDGNEDEPPPVAPPEQAPEPEPEPPEPVVTPPEPAPVPDPPPEAVVETPPEKKEEKPPEPPKPPKPPEPPKPPDPPKKSAAELREERIRKMRESVKTIRETPKPVVTPQYNGKTGPKTLSDEEMRKFLAMGAKIGSHEQLSTDENAISLGALISAMDAKWAQLAPQVGRDGEVHITVLFDRSRRVASCQLAKSSGDATSDAAALRVVRALGVVHGVTAGFAEKHSVEPITIRYHVKSSR